MFSERYWPNRRQQTEIGSDKERLALSSMRVVQLFPYDVSVKSRGETLPERIEQTKKVKRGACTAKHELLATNLNELGYSILFLTYPFLWGDLPVEYPKDILELAKHMPVQYHLALGLLINNAVELIDVTWDPLLKQAGFPIGEIGTNIVSMPMAVVPENIPIIHFTAEERAEYINALKSTMSWTQTITDFYNRLNPWLESLRSR